jgi:elongation factor P
MKAKDVRKGTVLLHNNAPYRVMDFHHHTPGNLRGMVQVKLRNLKTGGQTEAKFGSTEELEEAEVYTSEATFLYGDATGYHFMNSASYEEVEISEEMIGDNKYYLMDGLKVAVMTWNGDVIGLQLPKTVILTVADTEPELKGSTITNQQKSAKTDTGLTISVPPFIKIGEKVEVATETGQFMGRA